MFVAGLGQLEHLGDVGDVFGDRLLGDGERVGDRRVAEALGQQGQDLALAGGEPGRAVAGPFGPGHSGCRLQLAGRLGVPVADAGVGVLAAGEVIVRCALHGVEVVVAEASREAIYAAAPDEPVVAGAADERVAP